MGVSANTKNIHNELTLERLNQLAAQETTPSERPGALLLEDIHTAPGVFQRRRPGRYEEARVVADFVQALNTTPPRLPEPILVRAVGSRFFVVDGHHRLDAYRKVNWK